MEMILPLQATRYCRQPVNPSPSLKG